MPLSSFLALYREVLAGARVPWTLTSSPMEGRPTKMIAYRFPTSGKPQSEACPMLMVSSALNLGRVSFLGDPCTPEMFDSLAVAESRCSPWKLDFRASSADSQAAFLYDIKLRISTTKTWHPSVMLLQSSDTSDGKVLSNCCCLRGGARVMHTGMHRHTRS